MTAAVAIVEGPDVVVGIDSCSSDGDHRFDVTSKGPFAFDVAGHPPLLMVSAGLNSISTELGYGWSPPEPHSDGALAFLAACARSLREHFAAEPLWHMAKEDDGRSVEGHFIAAWRGVAVEISGGFGVSQARNGEVTIGSGRALMLGALAATRGRPAEERVRVALAAAAEYSTTVMPPFTVRWAPGR